MPIIDILQNFKTPIEFCPDKKHIFGNLYNDLELLETQDNGKNSGFYFKLFNPQSQAGKLITEKLSKFYTSNTKFLKDSQKLYKKCNILKNNPLLCQKAWDIWNKTKSDSNFNEKYQYIDFEKGRWLNESAIFLMILTFYSILSPLLNIIAPFLILLIPFGILKIIFVSKL